jgi:putative ABC transport system permease protein
MPVRIMMTSCQSSTDVVAIHGVDKQLFTQFRSYDIAPTVMDAFRKDAAGALVGKKMARRYGWKVGEKVSLTELKGISFNVTGILEQRGSADDYLIYTGRRFLQEADMQQGVSHYVLVKAEPGVEPSEVCRAIDALPLTVQTLSQPEEALVTTILDQLADLVRLSRGVIVVIIGVVLIAVGNAISMTVMDRSQEFGVMRTLGFPRSAIAGVVIGEGLLQGVIGAVAGCLLVQVLVWGHLVQAISTCALTVEFYLGFPQWLMTIAAVAAAAALGSILPAWRASQLNIVDSLRSRE